MSEIRSKQATILWLHGWGTSASVWRQLVERMPHYRHEFITYRDCSDMQAYSLVVQMKLEELNCPVVAVGWSLGSMLLLEYALRRRDFERLKQIIIVAGTLRFVDRQGVAGWPEIVIQRMQSNIRNGQAAETLAQFQQSIVPATMSEFVATDCSEESLIAALQYLRETDLRTLWREGWSEWREKISWLHGAIDRICPKEAIPAEMTPRLIMMPDQGHAPFLTDLDSFIVHLRRCLHED